MRENQSSVPTPSVWDNIPWRAADPVTEMLGPNFWGPKFLGPQNDEIQHPAVGGWGSYIFFYILSASAIFRAVGLQIDLRFLEAGLICCRL